MKLPSDVVEAIDNGVSQRTGKNLSEHSKKTYKSNLQSLFSSSGKKDFADLVRDVKGTSKTISANDNIHTRFAQLNALNMLFTRVPRFKADAYKDASKKWSDIQRDTSELYDHEREQNKLTKAQEKKYIEIPELRDIFNRHYAKFKERRATGADPDAKWRLFVKRLLVLALYALHPPVRQDYGCVRLYKTKKKFDKNHIVLPTGTLVLSEYKTSHSYGRVESKLPLEVIDILKTSLEIEPRQWLFIKGSERPYTHSAKDTNSFSTLVNRSLSELVGKPLDVTSIRRAYTTWLSDQKLTFADRRRIAEIMGHSVIQSMKYQVVQGGGSGSGAGGEREPGFEGIRVGGENIGFDQLTDSEVSAILMSQRKTEVDAILDKLTEEQREDLRRKL